MIRIFRQIVDRMHLGFSIAFICVFDLFFLFVLLLAADSFRANVLVVKFETSFK